MNELHLFAGSGGGILGGLLLGHRPVCAVEIEPYCRKVLLQRQRDGILPRFPIWDDVRTFNGTEWRGRVDVVCGGFPCTDISPARTNNDVNGKRTGLGGKHSGLWSEMARIIFEVQPGFAFIENSAHLLGMGFGQVIKDLAKIGYNARWIVLGSWAVGANHVRDRIWILAYSNVSQLKRGCIPCGVHQENSDIIRSYRRESESRLERVKDGMAHRVDRLKAIGNGQDCDVVALAFRILTEGLL